MARLNLATLITILLLLSTFFLGGCIFYGLHSPDRVEQVGMGFGGEPEINIPENDAGLHKHVGGEVLVGYVEGTDPEKLAKLLDAKIISTLGPVRAVRLKLAEDYPVTEAMRTLVALGEVRYAQPNYSGYTVPEPIERGEIIDLKPEKGAFRLLAADDPAFLEGLQYGPKRIGAPAAWTAGITGKNTVIAVIDTGIDASHEDLADKVLPGWNTFDDNDDTSDLHGHGTHVAGIAAAWGDNNIGMAGIAWDAKILPFKAGSYQFTDWDIARAIVIAADPEAIGFSTKKADIINMSLGTPQYSQFLQDVVNYAVEKGVVIVAAMGNTGKQHLLYPAACQGVIAVGATDGNDEVAWFSTSGPHISVSAPGVDIYSTLPGDDYARWSGTSMAAPHVAGAIALILEENPGLSPSRIKRLLEETADGENFAPDMGYGRINIATALDLQVPSLDYGGIKVIITYADTGDPVISADVVLYYKEEAVANIRSDLQGIAYFHDLYPGIYRLTTALHEPIHGVDVIEEITEIEVEEDEVTEVAVTL